MWVDRIKSFTLYCPDFCFILTQVCVFSVQRQAEKERRPDGTHSRSSLSSPPPPLAWACCLIYPWSSALPDTSESTLARRTCYYLVSRLLLCQKHTHKKRRGQFRWGDTGEITHFLFCFGERIPFEAKLSLSFCGVHSILRSWSAQSSALALQTGQSKPPRGPLWRRAGRLLSLYERFCCCCCWVPMWAPHFFTQHAVGKRCVATFVLGYKSHSVAVLSTLTPSQSFLCSSHSSHPSFFPPLSLLLWVSYCREESSLLTAEIRRCVS